MGRVFSYEQVISGEVPLPADFKHATTLFREQLRTGVEAGVFDGGMIFGSVARGTPNLRSDFDALIALGDDSDSSYRAAYELSRNITEESYSRVLIEPKVYPRAVLESGCHDIDHLFGAHLRSGFRLVDGVDPADYLRFFEITSRDSVADYIYQKARKLSSLYVVADPVEVTNNGLQRTLELPNSLGRKVVQALLEVGTLHDACDGSDKKGVFELSDEIFRNLGLHDGFARLTTANDEYTKLLEETIRGNVNQKTYNTRLTALHDEMPHAANWARAVGHAILPLLGKR